VKVRRAAILLTAMLLVAGVQADSITHGVTTINMDFIEVGYTNNAGDTTNQHPVLSTDFGAVNYTYRIAKYEVTADQWNAVRAVDPNVGDAGLYSGSQPTSLLSWLEAAKFANWLTSGSYSNGAYQFSDTNTLVAVDRAAAVSAYGTVYLIPTEDEWYKAAFFKSDGSGYTLYASGDAVPGVETDANYDGFGGTYSVAWDVGTGGIAENNGTFDMNGNVWEWIESTWDGTLDSMDENRVYRGGALNNDETKLRSSTRANANPATGLHPVGFRVASIGGAISPIEVGIFTAVEIGWTSLSGQIYQVQYSTNLVSTNWFDLGGNVVGNGATNYIFDSTRGVDEHFYRVIIE